MMALMEHKALYLTNFARFQQTHGSDPAWLQKLRQEAFDRFLALGFPTLDDEDWRFTPLAPLTRVPFETAEDTDSVPGKSCLPTAQDAEGTRLVLANGSDPSLQQGRHLLPDGVIVTSLARALRDHPQLVEPHLGQLADCAERAFTALNSAFLHDGAFIYLPPGKVVEAPIELDYLVSPSDRPLAWHRRCLIVAERHSQACIVERYSGPDGTPYFTSAVTEVVLDENAIIDHYKHQEEGRGAYHIGRVQVVLGRSSRFSSHALSFGGQLVRNEIGALLGAEGGECVLNGLYLAADDQLVDNHTRIDHARPHCTSQQLYKGILDGHGRGVFNGRIHVHQDAQKTDARQTNQTLLLSADALINTKPQLEIYADDVKCTHGATVGQLDAEALFYLRSRGLGEEEARSLLTFAFANDIIGRVKIEALRRQLEKSLSEKQGSGVRGQEKKNGTLLLLTPDP
jgi:Fe-S cluster assembly protein SufD